MHGMLEDNDGIRVNVNDPSSLGKLALDIASRRTNLANGRVLDIGPTGGGLRSDHLA